MLKDVKFRQALNWAIDKDKLVEIGLSGYGRPGTTVMPPDEWPADFDAHYEPTAEEKFGFDIAKANQLLDEAGYTDSDGNGIREYKGKDIELRLWARTESDEPARRKASSSPAGSTSAASRSTTTSSTTARCPTSSTTTIR